MLRLFRPKPPISPEAQAWVEESFARLSALPGERPLAETTVILPTEEFFPDPLGATEDHLRPLFARVCGYMKVRPQDVDLRLFHHVDGLDEEMRKLLPRWERERSGAAGTYQHHPELEKPVVTIKVERKNDFVSLVATMAHELAHVRLLHQAGFDRDARDMEPLTDLMTVHQGLGLFTANSAFQFRQFSDGDHSGWSTLRLGYLPEETFGYALALFAYQRGEQRPQWAKSLNTNLGAYFRQSMKYIQNREASD